MEKLMKRTTILFAFITIFAFASFLRAQSGPFILTFSGQTTLDGSEMMTISFTELEYTPVRLLEAVVPMTRDGECSQNTNLSGAVPIGLERATIAYDTATATYRLKWLIPSEKKETCRILVGDSDVDGRDFLIWRRSYGQGAGVASGSGESLGEPTGDDATIRVHYDTGYGNRITIRGSSSPSVGSK
jgi:hypothetical protein